MIGVEIEIQYFEGCPNSDEFISIVKKALERIGGNYDFREVLVESNEQARAIGFRGSPTLLIDGRDFENKESPASPGLNCRIYPTMPTEEEIFERIKAAVETKQNPNNW